MPPIGNAGNLPQYEFAAARGGMHAMNMGVTNLVYRRNAPYAAQVCP